MSTRQYGILHFVQNDGGETPRVNLGANGV